MKALERTLFVVMGLLLGVIGTFSYVSDHMAFLEDRALHMSKMSFMLGCTLDKNKTLVDCQKEPGFTNNEEIFKNIDAAMSEDSDDELPAKEKPVTAPFKEKGELSLVLIR